MNAKAGNQKIREMKTSSKEYSYASISNSVL